MNPRAKKNGRTEMPFLDHLEELRWRLFWALGAILLGAGLGIFAVIQLDLVNVLTAPLYTAIHEIGIDNPGFIGAFDGRMVFLNLTDPFFFVLKFGLMIGLVLSSPVVVYQVWAFLSPALEERERRLIVPSLAFGLVLFSAGVALAYFVALPATIRFLLMFGAEWFAPALTAGSYLSLVTRMLLAFGLLFELPIVVMILSALGVVTPAFLRSKRRHAIVGLTVLGAFLTPGDAVVVTLFLMVPLLVLYEVSIVVSAMVNKNQSTEAASVGTDPPSGSVPLGLALAYGVTRWRARAAAKA
jgi:sec-independent protein translocase protein TatC